MSAARSGGTWRAGRRVAPALCLTLALVVATPGAAPALAAQPRAHAPTRVAGESRSALVDRAQRALDAGRWTEAVSLWQRALAADGQSPEHWNALGVALLEGGRPRESVVAFDYALELAGGRSFDAALNLARAHAVLGDRDDAMRWLGRARALSSRPPSAPPPSLRSGAAPPPRRRLPARP